MRHGGEGREIFQRLVEWYGLCVGRGYVSCMWVQIKLRSARSSIQSDQFNFQRNKYMYTCIGDNAVEVVYVSLFKWGLL